MRFKISTVFFLKEFKKTPKKEATHDKKLEKENY